MSADDPSHRLHLDLTREINHRVPRPDQGDQSADSAVTDQSPVGSR